MTIMPVLLREKLLRRALALLVLVAATWPATSRADTLHVRDVKLSSQGADTSDITVTTSDKPRYSARVESGGLRLLVDISGADVAGAPGAITKGGGVVAGVMTQAFPGAAEPITRVLITLSRQAEFRISADATGLHIGLQAAAKTGPASGGLGTPKIGRAHV